MLSSIQVTLFASIKICLLFSFKIPLLYSQKLVAGKDDSLKRHIQAHVKEKAPS